VPDTVPPSPEAAVLVDYLAALAEGRYADAAVVLNDGALEPERRSDLRPLFTEFGDVDDLAARLRSWCEGVAVCTQPDAPPIDIGGYWMATWSTPHGVLTGYFRSGSFEGVANVRGLPPRANGDAVQCPTTDVVQVREADVDGDGRRETIVVTQDGQDGQTWLSACNTSLRIPSLAVELDGPVTIGVLATALDPGATLLFGAIREESVCGATYRMAQSAGALVEAGWNGCWGLYTNESIGCRDVGGQEQIVAYRYTFSDGDRLDNSTRMDVEVLSLAGEPLESFALTFPEQAEDGLRIVEPHCGGLPVVTEG
jgi:hypothetical protein